MLKKNQMSDLYDSVYHILKYEYNVKIPELSQTEVEEIKKIFLLYEETH